MALRVGGACINELGKAKGGKQGDQTGKEVRVQNYYKYTGGWSHILRPMNPSIGNAIASAVEEICANDNIGYDQNYRNTLWTECIKVGSLKGITKKVSCDCSSLATVATIVGFARAGYEFPYTYGSNAATTSTLVSRFKATGKFMCLTDKMFTGSSDYLRRGDIILKEGKHVVVMLDNGPKSSLEDLIDLQAATINPYKAPILTIKKGSKGEGVKWLQWQLKLVFGYDIEIDGSFGPATDKSVRSFQKGMCLTIDGKVGPATKRALKSK